VYKVILSRQAMKDLEKLKRANMGGKAKRLAQLVALNLFQTPPGYEKLLGNMQRYYSRRINDQHRFVYEVLANDHGYTDSDGNLCEGVVHVLCMWLPYERLR